MNKAYQTGFHSFSSLRYGYFSYCSLQTNVWLLCSNIFLISESNNFVGKNEMNKNKIWFILKKISSSVQKYWSLLLCKHKTQKRKKNRLSKIPKSVIKKTTTTFNKLLLSLLFTWVSPFNYYMRNFYFMNCDCGI